MRFLFPVMIALAATGSAQTLAPPARQSPLANQDCPEAAAQFAGKGGMWRGDPATPRKLAELPPADSFAAVYRRDERGCMVPVRYRDVRR